MKLIHRFAYYFGGFAMGLVILFFFLSGKKTSCDYGPNTRVLKNIRTKHRTFSPQAFHFFNTQSIDTAYISTILEEGDVDFSKSNTFMDKDSCDMYVIDINHKEQPLEVRIKNCDSLATVLSAGYLKEKK